MFLYFTEIEKVRYVANAFVCYCMNRIPNFQYTKKQIKEKDQGKKKASIFVGQYRTNKPLETSR